MLRQRLLQQFAYRMASRQTQLLQLFFQLGGRVNGCRSAGRGAASSARFGSCSRLRCGWLTRRRRSRVLIVSMDLRDARVGGVGSGLLDRKRHNRWNHAAIDRDSVEDTLDHLRIPTRRRFDMGWQLSALADHLPRRVFANFDVDIAVGRWMRENRRQRRYRSQFCDPFLILRRRLLVRYGSHTLVLITRAGRS